MQIRTIAAASTIVGLFGFFNDSIVPVARAQAKAGAASVYNPDIDLDQAPVYYRKRVIRFRNLLRQEPTKEAKVAKALSIAKNPKSPFRKDAITFLGDVKAKETVGDLIGLSKDREVREFTLFALTRMPEKRVIPLFIGYLMDANENVRGNAERGLRQVTHVDFSYSYNDPVKKRSNDAKGIQKWWKQNEPTFAVVQQTPEEIKQAEEAWGKYGLQYLQDLNR